MSTSHNGGKGRPEYTEYNDGMVYNQEPKSFKERTVPFRRRHYLLASLLLLSVFALLGTLLSTSRFRYPRKAVTIYVKKQSIATGKKIIGVTKAEVQSLFTNVPSSNTLAFTSLAGSGGSIEVRPNDWISIIMGENQPVTVLFPSCLSIKLGQDEKVENAWLDIEEADSKYNTSIKLVLPSGDHNVVVDSTMDVVTFEKEFGPRLPHPDHYEADPTCEAFDLEKQGLFVNFHKNHISMISFDGDEDSPAYFEVRIEAN